MQEPKQLKEQVKQLFHKYCGDQTLRAEEDADLEREVSWSTLTYKMNASHGRSVLPCV